MGIDMPVNELEQYIWTNRKPQDFDQYWSDAIKEMKQVNPEVSFEKSEYQLEM